MNVFGFEVKGLHCQSQVSHSDGVVTERTRWKMVARGKEGVITSSQGIGRKHDRCVLHELDG